MVARDCSNNNLSGPIPEFLGNLPNLKQLKQIIKSMLRKSPEQRSIGYKLTKQGKRSFKIGWRRVTSEAQGGKMLSTMTMDTNLAYTETDTSTVSHEELLFKREVLGATAQFEDGDIDYQSLKEGHITVTPLGALSHAETDCQVYFKE